MGGEQQAERVRGRRRAAQVVVLLAVVLGCLGFAPRVADADVTLPPGYVPRGDECGPYIPKYQFLRNNINWDCTFVDNFSTNSLDATKWTAQQTATSGYTLGGECQVNTPANISFVDDPLNSRTSYDHLRLTARRESTLKNCSSKNKVVESMHTGATVMTHGKFTQAYGRFEVRAKLPDVTVPGAQFSFWMFRQDLQPQGEIDPMEWYSRYSDRGIPMLHGATAPYTNNYCVFDTTMGHWHTYTLEWTPHSIKVLYDGVVCLHNTNWGPGMPAPFDTPMMIALTIGLDPQNPNTTTLPSSWSADIDYVKAWQ